MADSDVILVSWIAMAGCASIETATADGRVSPPAGKGIKHHFLDARGATLARRSPTGVASRPGYLATGLPRERLANEAPRARFDPPMWAAHVGGCARCTILTMIQRASLSTVASLSIALAAACTAPATGAGHDAADAPPPSDGGCAPQPVTAPVATWIPPHVLHSNVCTPQEVAAIVSCFVQGQSCNVAVSIACHSCAVSGDTTPYASAVIVHDRSSGKTPELNIAGCVGAASGDPSVSGCGAKLAAKDACIAASCARCTDQAGLQHCSTQAGTTVCATENAGAQCAAPYLAQCVQGTTQLEVAFNLVKVFCGP